RMLYVDSVPEEKMVDNAIIAMLKTLDPHSSYTDASETRQVTEPLQGNFSGIGIQFKMLNDTLFVVQTIASGPSEKVGILAGDRIIAVNDSAIAGVKMVNTDIMKRLRGRKGTKVDLRVVRRGVAEPINFRVVRDDIPLYSVDAFYSPAPGTAYIKISRFAESTAKEVREALADLEKQHPIESVVIDLQDNGGGYLQSAIELADMFLPAGSPVVYTEGMRQKNASYETSLKGKYADRKLIVLVNQYSASASEIFAGAVQDNDRGLVIGRRTFGKGLVQRPIPFPDGSMIRLTVARYHTPSGRCIQKPYALGESEEYQLDMLNRYESGELFDADSIHFSDSLRYTT
ncbi:MAG: S41 family peptidase, partial [Paramuribaculum sp.]|nr:S41 family peptidase [Paramuribaculum sp.]